MLTFLQFLAEAAIKQDTFSVSKDGKTKLNDKRIGQSGKKNPHGHMTVLWYKHPRMGLRVIDHAGGGAPITHAEWMDQEGVGPKQFDKLPRGRFQIGPDHRGETKVHELLHVGKSTPDTVYRHMEKNYKLKNLLFTDAHHISHEANYAGDR